MSYDYETLYRETPEALGAASTKVLKAFADHIPDGLRVLDVGCGQGRDALALARRGYVVIGIDQAPSGIRDMTAAAAGEKLAVTGHVADLRSWTPDEGLDAPVQILLCDRTLHMLAEDDRHVVLERLLKGVAPGGFVVIIDEAPNLPGLRAVLDASGRLGEVLHARKGDLFVKLD